MVLDQATHRALDVTRRLDAALDLGDLDLIASLLELRGSLMEEFAAVHRGAGTVARDASADAIGDLIAADRLLQERARTKLEQAASDLRGMAGRTRRGNGGYTAEAGIGCVDRKA